MRAPVNDSTAFDGPPQGRGVVELAAIKLRVRTSYRLQLLISGCIYEVTSPRYALRCFATHVETRSPPTKSLYCTPIGTGTQAFCARSTMPAPLLENKYKLVPAPAKGSLEWLRCAGNIPALSRSLSKCSRERQFALSGCGWPLRCRACRRR